MKGIMAFLILALGVFGASRMARGYSAGPPAGHTGDFNEPTCNITGCHAGNLLNATGGAFEISGAPEQYEPGRIYPINVRISKSGQQRWGFQLTARQVSSGAQAGGLTNTSNTAIASENGIQYISHNFAQFSASGGSWTFNWTAPPAATGAIRFSGAGNAANGNAQPTGDFIYTTTKSLQAAVPSMPTTAVFPQVAIGGGFSTVFALMNTGAAATSGGLVFTSQQGTPLSVRIEGTGTGSSFPVSVAPGGIQLLTAGPVSPADSTKSGWARVESSGGSVGGVATFQFTEGGVLKTAAGVLASLPVDVATIPVDNDDSQNRFTGFAVANTGSEDILVRVYLLSEQGTVLENVSPAALSPLGPGKQVAIFLHEIASSRLKFRGSMVVTAGGKKFAAVALVLNQGLLTAVPVIAEKPPGVP